MADDSELYLMIFLKNSVLSARLADGFLNKANVEFYQTVIKL